MAEYKARRRHVPAFGEWNYYYSPSSASPEDPPVLSRYGGPARAPEWWCSPEPEACSDVWFRYSPPPGKPPVTVPAKKTRRTTARAHCGAGAGKGSVAPVREQRGSAGAAAAAAAAAVAAGRAPGKGGSRGVVRPVDEDLYQVPPPDDLVSSGRRPRQRRASRSLWMGCLGGLGCIA